MESQRIALMRDMDLLPISFRSTIVENPCPFPITVMGTHKAQRL